MDSAILVAIITVCGTILAASLTFYFTKRHQLEVEWRHEKLNHYKVLLSAISDLAVSGTNKEEAHKRFALAVNTLCLCATQSVITALMKFHDAVATFGVNLSIEKHDQLLKELLLAIRRDIGLSDKDNAVTFNFHLIGSHPKELGKSK